MRKLIISFIPFPVGMSRDINETLRIRFRKQGSLGQDSDGSSIQRMFGSLAVLRFVFAPKLSIYYNLRSRLHTAIAIVTSQYE